MTYQWAEQLPDRCPPDEAQPPQGVFYRVVTSFPPQDRDFSSARQKNPGKIFNVDECLVKACSLFSEYNECRKILKLPRHKNKLVAAVSLNPESGLVLRTFERPFHYSWWRDKRFQILNYIRKTGEAETEAQN